MSERDQKGAKVAVGIREEKDNWKKRENQR